MTNNGANNPDDDENDNENGKLENELIDGNFNKGSSVLPNLPKFAKNLHRVKIWEFFCYPDFGNFAHF